MQSHVLADGRKAYYWRPATRDIKRGFSTSSEALGQDYAAAVQRSSFLNKLLDDWRHGKGAAVTAVMSGGAASMASFLSHLEQQFTAAQKRARGSDRQCSVGLEYLAFLFMRQNGRCAVTGTPFDLSDSANGRRKPFAPSIDRIDNSGGYTVGNVRLVCTATNIALSDWGDEVMGTIVRKKNGRG